MKKWQYNLMITPLVLVCAPLTVLLWALVPVFRALKNAARWAFDRMPRWRP
ncbi:MAG: hypothetical protein LBD68_06875 [Zoogloeaceae bacterium]|jgi:hypothetical protein|nr:hypothetical protein [Zoogloeaceae bacterium]